jgi:hypothetical protein
MFHCNFTEFPHAAHRLADVGAHKRATVGERAGREGGKLLAKLWEARFVDRQWGVGGNRLLLQWVFLVFEQIVDGLGDAALLWCKRRRLIGKHNL